MNKPKVSVIIATHNRAALLPRAVQSILDQTLQNFEIIIVDDASTDETPCIIEKMKEQDDRIQCFRSDKNIGPALIRNMGIRQAAGEFIAILDDDDESYPKRLETQRDYLLKNKDIGLVASAVTYVDENGKRIGSNLLDMHEMNPDEMFHALYTNCQFPFEHSTAMFRKREFDAVAGYPCQTGLGTGEDHMLFLKMAAMGVKFGYIQSALVAMQRSGNYDHVLKHEGCYEIRKRVYKLIRIWLKEKGITKYDRFHSIALSNMRLQYMNSDQTIGKIWIVIQAIWLAPHNVAMWKMIVSAAKKRILRALKIKSRNSAVI